MWNISKFFAKSKIYKKFKYFAKNLLKPKKQNASFKISNKTKNKGKE